MSLTTHTSTKLNLVAIGGPYTGQRYPLVGTVTVGSSLENGLRLFDALVRPRHAQIELASDGSVWVKNLSGSGQTLVNGAPVDRTELPFGSKVRIGQTELVVEHDGDEPLLPADAVQRIGPIQTPILLWQTEDLDGRYRIIQKLASGGMGDVFKAVHVELNKTVAVKIMRRELGNTPEFVERFKREAVACSHIGQHNIVDISDFGRTRDGRFYFVMEYLEGQTLSQLLQASGRLDSPRAIGIGLQIARALSAAHSRGIVHRDLKHDNVIVLQHEDRPDLVKVLDFGVAKVTGPSDQWVRMTSAGTVMGTPQYMSPEQASGLDVDSRSDIYSLGLILYELLTGKPVFGWQTPSVMIAAHIHQLPPSMSARLEGSPSPRSSKRS